MTWKSVTSEYAINPSCQRRIVALGSYLRTPLPAMEKSNYEEKTIEGSVAPDQLYRPEVDTSDIDEKKLLWKIDLHVIPWLTFVYLLNFLDRGSIGNAKVCSNTLCIFVLRWFTFAVNKLYNLEKDIKITDSQFLIALTVFFFPYALFEVSLW